MTKLSATLVILFVFITKMSIAAWASPGNAVAVGTRQADDQRASDRDASPFEWSIPGTVHEENGKPVAGATIETLPGVRWISV